MWLSKRKHDNEDFTLSLPTIPKGVDEISRKRFESFTNWKEKKDQFQILCYLLSSARLK